MSIVSVSLALLFLIKLRCGASVNTINYIATNYGEEGRRLLRSLWCQNYGETSCCIKIKVKMMSIVSVSLALLFLIKLRFGASVNRINYFATNYGEEGRSLLRSWWCQNYGETSCCINCIKMKVKMMSIVSVSLALLFLIKLRCGASVNRINYFATNYGEEGRSLLRSWWCQNYSETSCCIKIKVKTMSIVSVSLALLFLIKLRCGASVNTINYIATNYGEEGRRLLRSWWCQNYGETSCCIKIKVKMMSIVSVSLALLFLTYQWVCTYINNRNLIDIYNEY